MVVGTKDVKRPEEFIVNCEDLDKADDVEEGSSGKRKQANSTTTRCGKRKV